MSESNWYSIHVCVKCNSRLSNHQRMYSDGVCPKCGNVTGRTICDTYKVVIKKINKSPWWKFWDQQITYKGQNEISQKYLLSCMVGNLNDKTQHNDICKCDCDPRALFDSGGKYVADYCPNCKQIIK